VTTPAERGTAALRRALETGELDILDAAVDDLRTAVENGGDPGALANLGAALRTRHKWAPLPADLDEAIDVLREAVARSDPADPALAGRLGTWGVALGDRFEHSGAEQDLTASVAALQRALAVAGPDQVLRQSGNLAGAILERYRIARDPHDLDRAVDLASRAATGPATATPTDRDTACGNLAAALHERFTRLGRAEDLDNAIGAVFPGADGRPWSPKQWIILGTLLHARYVHAGNESDLENAVAALTVAEKATRPASGRVAGAERAVGLGVLGNALLDRFRRRGESADLDAAIAWHRAAVDLTPFTALDRAVRLSNLGVALAAAPEHHPSAAAGLDEALERHARAVELADAGIPTAPRSSPTTPEPFWPRSSPGAERPTALRRSMPIARRWSPHRRTVRYALATAPSSGRPCASDTRHRGGRRICTRPSTC